MLATRRCPVRTVTRNWTTSSIVRETMRTSSSPSQALAGHHRQRRQAIQRIARRVAVDGGQRALVAGVHRQQHVERFGAAHLADDDARRSHAQRVAHQVADGDLADAFDVLAAHLQGNAVWQMAIEHQLGDLFDGDDALVEFDDRGAQRIQQRRLARAGWTADQNVDASLDGGIQKLGRGAAERAQLDQLVERMCAQHEFTDGDRRPPRASREESRR